MYNTVLFVGLTAEAVALGMDSSRMSGGTSRMRGEGLLAV